jgi:V/A-type H+-transporting ATPase subunit I
MSWTDKVVPATMRRVALVAPDFAVRDMLLRVAESGTVQLDMGVDDSTPNQRSPAPAEGSLTSATAARLSGPIPDPAWCAQHGRLAYLAGEAELEAVAATAVHHGRLTGFVGWAPADRLDSLWESLSDVGAAATVIRTPRDAQPPTLLAPSAPGHPFAGLVRTYATPPYRDLDPSLFAGLAYMAMFGMMFADLGHGALLLAAALLLRSATHMRPLRRLAALREVWVLVAGAGLSSMIFGAFYGEFFGPTRVVPVVWLDPVDKPVPLLLAGVGAGAVLLASAYAVGVVNRWREGRWRRALYSPSGIAGAGLFAGLGVVTAGLHWHLAFALWAGLTLAVASAALAGVGFVAAAGGGASGVAQSGIEMFDLVIRLGSNIVSFARLAAFGLTHAALGLVVWQATTGAWRHGPIAAAGAVLIFAAGNALTFALEALIAGVQALRLDYYELFSRIFETDGEPFRPWRLPVDWSPTSTPLEGS